MKLLNFGSANYGTKGFIQSISMGKAKLNVYHAGIINDNDSQTTLDILDTNHINTAYIKKDNTDTSIDTNYIDFVFSNFSKEDFCILQNEFSFVDYIINKAKEKQMMIIFNAAPYTEDIPSYPLQKLDYLFLNETEANQITQKANISDILKELSILFPHTKIILTLGKKGSIYLDNTLCLKCIPKDTIVRDTTSVGNIFMSYFIYGLVNNYFIRDCLLLATSSANISVSRKGIINSIPTLEEVEESLTGEAPCAIEPF